MRWQWSLPIFLSLLTGALLFWLRKGELSGAAGGVGYLLWAIAVLCGVRLKLWDLIFASIGRAYRFHHLLGRIVGLFALVHTGLVLWDLASLDSVGLVFDLSEPLFLSGWLGLVLLVLPVALSTIKKMRRFLWKRVHQVLILGLAVIAWHLYETGTSEQTLVLVMLVFGLFCSVVAIVSLLVPGLIRRTLPYQVSEVRHLSPEAVEISLRDLGPKLNYRAGQFIYLSIQCGKNCGVSRELHPFTLSSAPHEDGLRVAVRALGDDTSCLMRLKPGNNATVEGPYGDFLTGVSYVVPQLWIAGGIGVTPFISLLRAWSQKVGLEIDVDLVILVKTEEDHVFAADLSVIADRVSGLRVHVWIDERDGVLSTAGLQKLLKYKGHEFQMHVDQEHDSREVAISGSSEMVSHIRDMVRDVGLKTIRSEGFEFL